MRYFKNNFILFFILLVFVVSRWYIFQNPPANYSDVKADYERYANMWRYGLPPYLQHLYEYPPATIPLLYTPLVLDQAGIGKYYANYRTQILIIDVIFFSYLFFIVHKIPWLKKRKFESLLIYILLTTLAKDFFYEGIDLAFTACATVSFTLLYFMPEGKQQKWMRSWLIETLIWTFFWLSFGIKFLTLPLALPLFLLLHRGKLTQQIATCVIGFLIIWGLPLALYRSSLQVMFVHNNNRPIKYASLPAHLIRWINTFTNTEEQRMVAPDFEYKGPVSDRVTQIVKIIFPMAVMVTIVPMGFLVFLRTRTSKTFSVNNLKMYIFEPVQLEKKAKLDLMIWFYIIYIFVLFITAKIFSQPFHIWYLAPITLASFNKRLTWYITCALCALMILLDMTTLLHIKNNFLILNTVEIALVRDAFRFIPMFIILILCVRELKNRELQKVTN